MRILLSLVVIFLISCGGGSPDSPVSDPLLSCNPEMGLIECLAVSCESAGGTMSDSGQCICPTGKTFFTQSSISCQTFEIDKKARNVFTNDSTPLISLLTPYANSPQDVSAAYLELSQDSLEKIDLNQSSLNLLSYRAMFANYFRLYIKGEEISDSFTDAIHAPPFLPTRSSSYDHILMNRMNKSFVYLEDIKSAKAYLKGQKLNYDYSNIPEDKKVFKKVLDNPSDNLDYEADYNNYKEGCAKLCDIHKGYNIDGKYIYWMRTFYYGNLYENILLYRDKNLSLRFAHLNQHNEIMYFSEVFYVFKKYTYDYNIRVQDINGNIIKNRFLTYEINPGNRNPKTLNPKQTAVALCDMGLKNHHSIVENPLNKDSYYGWIEGAPKNFYYFFYGRDLFSFRGFDRSRFYNNSHGVMMADVIAKENSAVIPLIVDCHQEITYWDKNVSKTKSKIINNSNFVKQSPGTCQAHSGFSYNLDYLWVYGTDNKNQIKSLATAYECPQAALSGKDNALIVAGKNGNKGSNYVDLVNDNYSQSSEATAQVSAVLNNMLSEDNELSNYQLKKALMASVEMRGYVNQSRSGGFLDKDKAYEAGKLISKNKGISVRKLVEKLRCKNGCDQSYETLINRLEKLFN